jgi:hypothetical protein
VDLTTRYMNRDVGEGFGQLPWQRLEAHPRYHSQPHETTRLDLRRYTPRRHTRDMSGDQRNWSFPTRLDKRGRGWFLLPNGIDHQVLLIP